MSRRVIALTGYKGAGKTTIGTQVANILREEGIGCRLAAFADKMKDICAVLGGVSLLCFYEPDAVRNVTPTIWRWEDLNPTLAERFPKHGEFVTVRELNQLVAEDLFRFHFTPKTWIRLLEKTIADCQTDLIVVTDLRKLAEVEALRVHPMLIIKVIDPDQPADMGAHSTELEIDAIKADVIYINDKNRCLIEQAEYRDWLRGCLKAFLETPK